MKRALKTDKFEITVQAGAYLAFLDCGYSNDDAVLMSSYAAAHPAKLWENIKPSIAREWAAQR